jgi:hypothetical protein
MAHFQQATFWQAVRSGAWLTAGRIRGYSLILIGFYAIAIVGWIALSHGLIDPNGKPLGTDFSSFYAAGSMVLEGRATAVYDMAAHYAREQQIFGAGTPYYGWFYPPLFLLVAAPLALMPYLLALAVWQGVTLIFYLGVIAAILRPARLSQSGLERIWPFAALAFPAIFINLGHGQNGLFTAGLLGAALLALPCRPLLSGLLFGCLAYKPQFALVIPVALVAASQWRTAVAATLTVLVLVAVTTLALGTDIWSGFFASMDQSRRLLLEQGSVGFEKLQSVFAAVRMWGGGLTLAYIVQGLTSATTICGVVWVWRDRCDDRLKAATLIVAALLASPHTLDYDLTIAAPAIAFLTSLGLARGFRDFEISLLATAWIMPLLTRSIAGLAGIPLGMIVLLALYAFTLRRAAHDRKNVHNTAASSRARDLALRSSPT